MDAAGLVEVRFKGGPASHWRPIVVFPLVILFESSRTLAQFDFSRARNAKDFIVLVSLSLENGNVFCVGSPLGEFGRIAAYAITSLNSVGKCDCRCQVAQLVSWCRAMLVLPIIGVRGISGPRLIQRANVILIKRVQLVQVVRYRSRITGIAVWIGLGLGLLYLI